MRLHILSTASALLLLSLFTSQTQAQGQGQDLPPFSTVPIPVPTNNTDAECLKCRNGLFVNINPECPKAILVAPSNIGDPVEAFKNLPRMTQTCQCATTSPGFLDPCAGSDLCGPLYGVRQRSFESLTQICAILRAAETGGDNKNAGSRIVVGTPLSAGLAVAVVTSVAAIAL
ncbi:hypothetical protein BGX24_009020 [Mortierella sp. AD032]|nr:hypothetical protein BGX24_009020 [Mortierella sp. AD032]